MYSVHNNTFAVMFILCYITYYNIHVLYHVSARARAHIKPQGFFSSEVGRPDIMILKLALPTFMSWLHLCEQEHKIFWYSNPMLLFTFF